MPEYRVTLETLIQKARRHNCSHNHLCLVLALAEVGAWHTPYFAGLKDEELANEMVRFVKKNLRKFFMYYTRPEWTEEDIYEYLAELKEFKFDPEAVKNIYQRIKKKGEMNYGFRNIDKMGTGNRES